MKVLDKLEVMCSSPSTRGGEGKGGREREGRGGGGGGGRKGEGGNELHVSVTQQW